MSDTTQQVELTPEQEKMIAMIKSINVDLTNEYFDKLFAIYDGKEDEEKFSADWVMAETIISIFNIFSSVQDSTRLLETLKHIHKTHKDAFIQKEKTQETTQEKEE